MKTKHRRKRITALMLACMVALVLAVSGLSGVLSMPARAATYGTLSEYFGISPHAILHELKSHEKDSYYLGTPYRNGNDYAPEACLSPNGDANSFGPGLNCTGFLAHVFRKAGADLSKVESYGHAGGVTNATNWFGAIVDSGNVDAQRFDSVEALLASGQAQKGDIIYCDPLDWSAPGADCHVGFFWGNSPSDNKFWHSGESPASGNQISAIIPKTVPSQFFLIKTGTYPALDPITVLLRKTDSGTGAAQGSASLQGAQFTVKYYDGLYTREQVSGVSPTRTWVFQTDADGEIYFETPYFVSGDAFYLNSWGYPAIPTGTITVQETKAPAGYLLNDTLYHQQITANQYGEVVVHFNAPTVPEQVIRGGVRVEKWDNETGSNSPQGGATLEGAVFEIYNRNTGSVRVDGADYAPGAVVATITTNGSGVAETAKDLLPYGSYEVIEKAPPDGYLKTGVLRRTFSITANNVFVDLNTSSTAIRNDPIRGDLEGIKISEDMGRLAEVPFKITSKTTGESHIVVTDENGQFSTASSWNLHSNNTNAGLTPYDGVWFGDISALDDAKGALPYDTYVVEEMPCAANVGYQLCQPFEVKVSRSNVVVNLGTITNTHEGVPEIGTTALDRETGTHFPAVSESTTIVDRVAYTGLTPGMEYTVSGVLMDKATGKELLVDGEKVTGTATFTPAKSSGSVDVEFTFNSLALAGKAIVVFETLYYEDSEIAVHADIDDDGQTVTFPLSGKLKVYKLDAEEKKPLAGAEFTVYGEDESEVGTLVSDETGWAEITLPEGKYTVKETKAPEGFILDESIREFAIDENGIEVPYTVLNSRTPEPEVEVPVNESAKPFPKTGVRGI